MPHSDSLVRPIVYEPMSHLDVVALWGTESQDSSKKIIRGGKGKVRY